MFRLSLPYYCPKNDSAISRRHRVRGTKLIPVVLLVQPCKIPFRVFTPEALCWQAIEESPFSCHVDTLTDTNPAR